MNLYTSYSDEIPKNKKVTIKFGDISFDFVYDNELSFSVKTSYDSVVPSGGNDLLTILSGLTHGTIPSGQFQLQSAQIWKKTEPLDINLSGLKVYMKNDAYNDVVYPIKTLQKMTVPRKKEKSLIGMLIPPGPDLITILKLTNSNKSTVNEALKSYNTNGSKGIASITIGNFKFNSVMLTNVDPKFSTTMDSKGYPISAEVDLNFTSVMVPTEDYIDSIY